MTFMNVDGQWRLEGEPQGFGDVVSSCGCRLAHCSSWCPADDLRRDDSVDWPPESASEPINAPPRRSSAAAAALGCTPLIAGYAVYVRRSNIVRSFCVAGIVSPVVQKIVQVAHSRLLRGAGIVNCTDQVTGIDLPRSNCESPIIRLARYRNASSR